MPTSDDAKTMLESLDEISASVPDELVITSPLGDGYSLIFRNDHIVELRADPASVSLSSDNGYVTLKGNVIKLLASLAVKLETGAFMIGDDIFNPDWLGKDRLLAAVMTDPNFGQLVAGVPLEGQFNKPLSQLFSEHPIFEGGAAESPIETLTAGFADAVASLDR